MRCVSRLTSKSMSSSFVSSVSVSHDAAGEKMSSLESAIVGICNRILNQSCKILASSKAITACLVKKIESGELG